MRFSSYGTVDYQSRRHELKIVFAPYLKSEPLSIEDALNTLNITYEGTTFHEDEFERRTTGLDALQVRPEFGYYPYGRGSEPQSPIPSLQYDRLSVDAEGIVANIDGS